MALSRKVLPFSNCRTALLINFSSSITKLDTFGSFVMEMMSESR